MADLATRLVAARRSGGTVTLAAGELPDDMAAAQAGQARGWPLLAAGCRGKSTRCLFLLLHVDKNTTKL